MGALHHRKGAEPQPVCIYCHGVWPCDIARARLELAKAILKEVADDPVWRPKHKAGMARAAGLLVEGLTGDIDPRP